MRNNEPIDAVVMWVDGSEPGFIEVEAQALKQERALGKKPVTAAARHRDNGELRFALRSILQYIPWIRRIYVVTNGQKPTWLTFDGTRIQHVTHADIFPNKEMLPCFNTFAIESCLHRISGLSETFLRFSDDFFIGRPASRQDILGEAGFGRFIFKGKVQLDPDSRYQKQILHNAQVYGSKMGTVPRVNVAHAPQVRRKSVFEDFTQAFSDEIAQTRMNRFRDANDIIPLFLYPYYLMQSLFPEDVSQVLRMSSSEDFIVEEKQFGRWFVQVQVGGNKTDWRSNLRKLSDTAPLYFNINDQFDPASYDEELNAMLDFLMHTFPTPATQERHS